MRRLIFKGRLPSSLCVQTASRSGYIERIDPGLVADWNRVYPDIEIQPGDRIVAVNGVEDLTLMPAAIKKSDKITLMIERAPPEWQVELEPERDLGLVKSSDRAQVP